MSPGARTVGRTAGVIVAAGKGERLQEDLPKQYLDLGGRPVLSWSVEAFAAHDDIDLVVVVLGPEYAASPPAWLPADVLVVAGGDTRAESVRAGLSVVQGRCDVVLIHDGARPFATRDLISRVIEAAGSDAIVPVVELSDTVKVVDPDGWVLESPPRDSLYGAQTPQGFPIEVLARAHAAIDGDPTLTDDALACERIGLRVGTLAGEPNNFKITTAEDLSRARWLVDAGLIQAGT